ncbi:MAG: hypothetical protein AAF587_33595 [Bacteroidota bacterium]
MKLTHLLTTLLSLAVLSFSGWAQDVSEGNQSFMKKETKNALSIVLRGQSKNVSAVLDQKFKLATGSKAKVKSGLKMYEGVHHADLSSNRMDVYYKVDRVGKSDKNSSRITLFMSSGNMNFMTSETFPEEMANATDFLQGLEYDVKIYEMELAIEDQEKVIAKAIKEQEKLEKDSVNLEQKLAETLQAIEDNKVARATQIQTIQSEEGNLNEFRTKLEATKTESFDAAVARRAARDGSAEVSRIGEIKDEGAEEKTEEEKKTEEGGEGGNNN